MPSTNPVPVSIVDPRQWDRAISVAIQADVEPEYEDTHESDTSVDVLYRVGRHLVKIRVEVNASPSIVCTCRQSRQGRTCSHAAAAMMAITPIRSAWPLVKLQA